MLFIVCFFSLLFHFKFLVWQLLNSAQNGNATAGGAGTGAVQNGTAAGQGTGFVNAGLGILIQFYCPYIYK